MGKRVLFLGQTGVAKKEALANLAAHCQTELYKDCDFLDFDVDYLLKRVNQPTFLDDDIHSQRRDWNEAWDACFRERLEPLIKSGKDVFLGLHGCYIRTQYGARCVLDLQRVKQFNPTLIITLIADVYDMWWRTESRAKGEAWRGRPTIEHLLGGRRSEVLVADLIALECGKPIRSLVIAVGHPCDTVAKCVFNDRVKVVYLSFPISEPRRMAKKGDNSGLQEVSRFIAAAHERQRQPGSNLAFICPLAIDELPLREASKGITEATLAFDRDAARWSLSDFWPAAERMAVPPAPYCDLRTEEVQEAVGSIKTDVAWRDFRLAEQADMLAVFNPVFNSRDEVSGGVANEVSFATRFGHPIYIHQDPKHDSLGTLAKWLNGFGRGTMGEGPSAQGISVKDSISELFSALK